MAHVYPYPTMKPCSITGMEGLFWADVPATWLEGKNLPWFRQMQGWTRSDDFRMQAELLGVSQTNLADIAANHDGHMRLTNELWRLDAANRWQSMAWRYSQRFAQA